MISDSHRFIFIHIYKTGGTSLRRVLSRYADAAKTGRLLPHSQASEVRAAFPDLFADYFTFAFVRNPWALEVSMYEYGRRQELLPESMTFGEFLVRERPGRPGDDPHRCSIQLRRITDESGAVIVDHVGRTERLDEEFRELVRRLRLGNALTRPFLRLRRENRSVYRDYRTWYDEQAYEHVAHSHRFEIARFGYTFDDAAPARR